MSVLVPKTVRRVVLLFACASVMACGSEDAAHVDDGVAPDNVWGNASSSSGGGFGAGEGPWGNATGGARGGSGSGGSTGWVDEEKPGFDDFVGYDDDPEGPCGYGIVYGVVCSKSEQMFVNDAAVWVVATDCDGLPTVIETQSSAAGYFTLEHVPSGYQTVNTAKDGFSHAYTVLVAEKQVTDITAVGHKDCFKAIGESCPTGSIKGYVCAPNETTSIGGATVSVATTDCNGKPVKLGAVSDQTGNYEINGVPTGQVEVVIEKGSFQTSYIVNVLGGQVIDAEDVVQDQCFDEGNTNIAVVTGDWDTIQNVLGALGLSYDLYDGMDNNEETIGLLSDLETMKEYDIIFFNCGGDHDEILLSTDINAILSNLQAFVSQGGSVYASDWAFLYVEWPWPQAISFVGGDMNPIGPKMGAQGTMTGTVTDAQLSAHLGKKEVELNYDLGAWVVADGAGPQTQVHIEGNVSLVGNVPLMLSHDQGLGRVLYTTFHNEPQVTGDMQNILEFLVFTL